MTNDNRLVTLIGPLGALLFFAATGCGDDASYDLLSGDREGATVFSRSDLRIRLPGGEVRDVADTVVTAFLRADCTTRAPSNTSTETRPCVLAGRTAHIELCIANRLLEIADSPAAQPLRRYATKSEVSGFGTVLAPLADAVVLPPERAQQAAMLSEARGAARRAQTAALEGKASIGGAEPLCGPVQVSKIIWPSTVDGLDTEALNLDDHLAVSMIEANQLIFETSDKLVRASLAAADRRMGDTASPQDIARHVWVGDDAFAGRFDVAHAIASGRDGLPAALPLVREHGMCGITPLNSTQKRALGALRVSGIAPSVFASTSTIDTILTGGAVNSNVGDRLAAMYNNTSLATMTVDELLEYLDVTAADMAAARRYLVQEFAAFGRIDVTIPDDFIPGTPTLMPSRSAATVYEPSPPDAAYWGALASLSPFDTTVDAPPVPDDRAAHTSFMAVTTSTPSEGGTVGEDQILAYSIGALEVAGRDDDVDTRFGPEARSLINSQLTELERPYKGLVRTCINNTIQHAEFRIYHRMPDTAAFRIVKGHAGLQCATTGFVEGVSCNTIKSMGTTWWDSVNNIGSVSLTDYPSAPPVITSFSRFRDGMVITSSLGAPGTTELLFVVYNQEGAGGGDPNAPAGHWKVLTGQAITVSPTSFVGTLYCVDRPAIDGLDEAVKQVLEPSTTNCTQPATSCAGIPSNQLIPLENDLTSDGDPVESSWRHYLDSALASAAVADELGEQLIREGLEQDARVESAVDELAAACGVQINLDGIVGTTAVPRTLEGPCTTSCATSGYTCIAGTCTLDPVALAISRAASDADAARLRRCLGSDDVGAVSLGSARLCAWKDGNGDLCGRAGSPPPEGLNEECPFAVTATSPCPTYTGGYRTVGPTRGLGYFAETREDPIPTPPVPGTPPCQELANLRSPGTSSAAQRQAWAGTAIGDSASWWATTAVASAARRLNWRPLPGDFSEVTLDDGRWIRVGSPGGLTTGYPCAPDDLMPMTTGDTFMGIACRITTTDPTESGSLFCVRDACGGSGAPGTLLSDSARRSFRARMNDRLARAVITARMIAGVPLGGEPGVGVEVPTYPLFRGADRAGSDGPDEYWARFRRAAWSATGTLEGHQFFSTSAGEIFSDRDHSLGLRAGDHAYYVASAAGDLYPAYVVSVTPTIPVYSEYTGAYLLRPASGVPHYEVFDSNGQPAPGLFPDSDDNLAGAGFDFNIPLIVRTLPPSVNAANASPVAALIWSGMNGTELQPRGAPAVRVYQLIESLRTASTVSRIDAAVGPAGRPTESLTRYWISHNDGNTQWAEAVRDASDEYGVDHNFTLDGNRAFIGRDGMSEATVMDAVELLCAAQLNRESQVAFGEIPSIQTVEDLGAFADYLRVESARSQGQAAKVIFEGFPVDGIVNADSAGAETGGSGDGLAAEFGTLVASLRVQMNDLADQRRVIALDLSLLSNDAATLQNALTQLDAERDVIDAQLSKEIANQVTACATAVTQGIGLDPLRGAGAALAAVATCVNSQAQASLSGAIAEAQGEGLDASQAEAINVAEASFRNRSRGLGTLATQVRGSVDQIRGTLQQIEATRARGRRALAKALMLDSDEAGAEYAVDTLMRRRLNTTAIRYQRAFDSAVRQAYIAKLAIEQRLGMPLSSLTAPMRHLDEAPSRWQMDVCSMTGIDYDRIRDSAAPPGGVFPAVATPDGGVPEVPDGSVAPSFDDYSGQYIGDYVRKLALVVESYPFDFPYEPSSDAVVVSLRDEIMHIRTECPTIVNNYLLQSGHLDVTRNAATGALGWEAAGCPDTSGVGIPDGGVDPPPLGCVAAVAATGSTCAAPVPPSQYFGDVQPFEVRFGDWSGDAGVGGLTNSSRLIQWVTLDPGVYRLSWYGPRADTSVEPVKIRTREWRSDPRLGVPDAGALGELVEQPIDPTAVVPLPTIPPQSALVSPTASCGTPALPWRRFWRMFEVVSSIEVGIAIEPTTPSTPEAVIVGGLMLEEVSADAPFLPTGAVPGPSRYVDTEATRTRNLRVCEDSDGREFRRTGWQHDCKILCRDGIGAGCTGSSAAPYCYWETQFDISQRQIERGELIRGGGFAYGNFNYRIEDIALNVVGTYARDCAQALLLGYTSSVCYANGTVPYSLYHTGDFTVRNHAGDDYDAPLFNGAIEYARALATEDYITNPISSASASRLEPFRKREFSGRPINGTYTLRIWDDPAVDFSSIDDIQIVMNYRYWTRFGR